jgi:hypothetical protein|tara:strand:+ start:13858 stop:14046 length:189 start_codon:yes stop_codon:yes gene_type:complete
MRYTYKIKTKDKEETIEAMSFKKMLQSLVLKFPKMNVLCMYKNKKGNNLAKWIDTTKIKIKY